MPKKMTKAERAAYMRVYRARKAAPVNPEVASTTPPGLLLPGLGMGTPGPAAAESSKPFRLVAPIDDCAWVSPAGEPCGHDRHTQHEATTGPCLVYVGRRRCPCPGFFGGF